MINLFSTTGVVNPLQSGFNYIEIGEEDIITDRCLLQKGETL